MTDSMPNGFGPVETNVTVRGSGFAFCRLANLLCFKGYRRSGSFRVTLRLSFPPKRTRRCIPNNRVQPVDNVYSTTRMLTAKEFESWTNANKAAHCGQHCEHRQRRPHVGRRFMRYVYPVPVRIANMFARLMPRPIAGGEFLRVVRRQALIKCRGVGFISFTTGRRLVKFLFA